jgi:hypothetical protein
MTTSRLTSPSVPDAIITAPWHATTTTVVPPSPAAFELRSPQDHGRACPWPKDVAPRHLIYLGDATSLVFAVRAITVHGGMPVLLEVDATAATLQPDPAYLVARSRLLGPNQLGCEPSSSWEAAGRVATQGPVRVRARHVCTDVASLLVNLQTSGLVRHAEAWHDDQIWREAQALYGLRFSTAAEWRRHVGKKLTAAFFRPY